MTNNLLAAGSGVGSSGILMAIGKLPVSDSIEAIYYAALGALSSWLTVKLLNCVRKGLKQLFIKLKKTKV